MEEKLTNLLRTMSMIETKGDSTEIMADCRRFLRQLIAECHEESTKKADAVQTQQVIQL